MFNFFKNKKQANTNKKEEDYTPMFNAIDYEDYLKNYYSKPKRNLKTIEEVVKFLPRKPLKNTAIIGQVEAIIGGKIPPDIRKIITHNSGICIDEIPLKYDFFHGLNWNNSKNVLFEVKSLKGMLEDAEENERAFYKLKDLKYLIPIGSNYVGDMYVYDTRNKRVKLLSHEGGAGGEAYPESYTLFEIVNSIKDSNNDEQQLRTKNEVKYV